MARIYITDNGGLDVSPAADLLTTAGHTVVPLDLDPGGSPDSGRTVAGLAKDADALIVSYVEIDAATINALPDLQVIATTTMGSNQIDLATAAARGISVHTLPPLSAEEVATHALAGTLALLREIPASRTVAREDWDFTRIPTPPRVSELTLGVYGMGRIARRFLEVASPLFGRVVAFDPYVPDDAWPTGLERAHEPDDLFRASNVISLHVPLTETTRHAVNAHTLGLMPQGSYLVNVSRGALIDTEPLTDALDSGQLFGAFLDVLPTEPPVQDDPLLQRPDVIVTPHSAFYSSSTAVTYVTTPAQSIITEFEENRP